MAVHHGPEAAAETARKPTAYLIDKNGRFLRYFDLSLMATYVIPPSSCCVSCITLTSLRIPDDPIVQTTVDVVLEEVSAATVGVEGNISCQSWSSSTCEIARVSGGEGCQHA